MMSEPHAVNLARRNVARFTPASLLILSTDTPFVEAHRFSIAHANFSATAELPLLC
jgi:hypothetical protein